MRRVQRDTCHGDGWMRRRGVDWDRICIADLHSLPVRLNNKVVMGPTRVDRHGWRGHIIGMPMNERLFLFRRKAIKVKISIISFFFIFITACLRHRMGFSQCRHFHLLGEFWFLLSTHPSVVTHINRFQQNPPIHIIIFFHTSS